MPDWKGMFKKGAELAQQAKTEIEKTGLLDQARDALKPAPAAPPPPERNPTEQVREVLRAGQPDPFVLVTTDDVRQAFGGTEPVGPRASYSDSSGGPSWTLPAAGGEVTVDVALYADPYDIDELLSYGDDEIHRLPGVGDHSGVAGDMVAVSRGGETLTVMISGPQPGAYRTQLEALARAAAGRLPDFREYALRMSAPGGPVLTDALPTDAVSAVMGIPLEHPTYDRDEERIRATWSGPEQPYDDEGNGGGRLEIEVTHFVVDPWDRQQQQAAAGNVWAKAAVDIGEAFKAQLAEHFKPVPGPWDEGYLGPEQAYFKKGGRSFQIEISGAQADTTAQVAALATRLGENV